MFCHLYKNFIQVGNILVNLLRQQVCISTEELIDNHHVDISEGHAN